MMVVVVVGIVIVVVGGGGVQLVHCGNIEFERRDAAPLN